MLKNCIIGLLLLVLVGGATYSNISGWLVFDKGECVVNREGIRYIYKTKHKMCDDYKDKDKTPLSDCVAVCYVSGNTLYITDEDYKEVVNKLLQR